MDKILPYKMSHDELLKAVRIANDILNDEGTQHTCPVWKLLTGNPIVHWNSDTHEEECEAICQCYYQCDRIAAVDDYWKLKDWEIDYDEIETFMRRYPECEMDAILQGLKDINDV